MIQHVIQATCKQIVLIIIIVIIMIFIAPKTV